MKKLTIALGLSIAACGVCTGTTGSWTLKRTSTDYSSFTTASNWQDGYVPTNANDSLEFKVTSDNTNDRGNSSSGAIFGMVVLPKMGTGLTFDSIDGYRQYRLRTGINDYLNSFSFLDVSGFLGTFELASEPTFQIRAEESGATQQLHGLKVCGKPTLDVEGGVVELGKLAGEGTLVKSGSGELRLSGVTAAPGVRIRAEEGSVTLKGVPSVPSPVAGAALHIDASRTDTITAENGVVQAITDTRGSTAEGYYGLTRYVGYPSLVPWGDKQLINFGYCRKSSDDADLKARWGEFGSMSCNETIAGVKTMFVAFRWNADDDNGNTVFPLNDETGYLMRTAVPDTTLSATNCAMMADWSAFHLFIYQQYSDSWQSYAPQSIVTGDIRRNGESVTYNATPRGFRNAMECLSININTNGMASYALPWFSFKYLARMQNQGYTGGSQVGEILIYTNALTDAEQKQNIDYLTAKWGCCAGTRPWLAASVGGSHGASFNVPAGETAYVKSIDTRSGAFVKTGGGTLAVRHLEGDGVIRVEGGAVEFVGGKTPEEPDLGVTDPKPASGITAHFDAAKWNDTMVFDPAGGTNFILRWDSLSKDNKTIDNNLALMVTNATQSAFMGMKPYLVDGEDGKKWVDFGALTVSSSRRTDTPTSGWFRVTRLDSMQDKGNNHLREMFWVWKTRPAADGTNPILCGSSSEWWRYARPGKGVMLNARSSYTVGDANDMAFRTFLDAQWTVDGRPVDPIVENFPEDVHVVRFSLGTGRYVSGIGNDWDLVKGGFQLGELLMYSRELTDHERAETEAYLMKKWKGVQHPNYAGAAPSAAQVVYASSPASLAATEGTVQMSFVDDTARPTLDTSEKTFIHIDVSDISTVSYSTDANGDKRVTRIDDPRGNGLYAAIPSSYSGGGTYTGCKLPILRVGRLNGRNVLDLGENGSSDVSCIRWWDASGERFQGASVGALIVYANRDEGYYADPFSAVRAGYKTWRSGGDAAIFDPQVAQYPQATEATLYLDGESRANTAGGYPSGFHVLYMQNGRGWGHELSGLGANKDNNGPGGGMLVAEMYVFTNAPSASERTEAIAYLMKKWGIGGQSFAAPSVGSISAAAGAKVKLGTTVAAASLSGAGTVEAPCLTNVTAIAATVTGAGTTECLTVDGEVALGANGTATVTFASGTSAEIGFYPILNATSFAAGTDATLRDWTISILDAPHNVKGRLVVRDGAICLEVFPSGTMLIFR